MDMGFEPTAGATPATGGEENEQPRMCQEVERLVVVCQVVAHQVVALVVACY